MICVVCNTEIASGEWYNYHARLDVYLHVSCPATDVCGENIEGHTMLWGQS